MIWLDWDAFENQLESEMPDRVLEHLRATKGNFEGIGYFIDAGKYSRLRSISAAGLRMRRAFKNFKKFPAHLYVGLTSVAASFLAKFTGRPKFIIWVFLFSGYKLLLVSSKIINTIKLEWFSFLGGLRIKSHELASEGSAHSDSDSSGIRALQIVPLKIIPSSNFEIFQHGDTILLFGPTFSMIEPNSFLRIKEKRNLKVICAFPQSYSKQPVNLYDVNENLWVSDEMLALDFETAEHIRKILFKWHRVHKPVTII